MRPVGVAAIKAGIIPEETLDEFKRWGALPTMAEHDLKPFESIEDAVEGIQEAIESEEQVRLQTTDLDALRWYLDERNQRRGRLVLVDSDTEERATKTITFSVLPASGKLVIPWITESIIDMMSNGLTYLSYKDKDENVRVYFSDVEEMYFGSVKAFMMCTGKEYTKDERSEA